MIPIKVSGDTVAEAPQRLSKAKRRRLRKKKLQQSPREDGGEGQAELPSDTDLELRPIVEIETVVNSVDSLCCVEQQNINPPEEIHKPAISGSFTLTSVSYSESVCLKNVTLFDNFSHHVDCIPSKENTLNERSNKIIKRNHQKIVDKNSEISQNKTDMADSQTKKQKSPQKHCPSSKSSNPNNPKVSQPKSPISVSKTKVEKKPVTQETTKEKKEDEKKPVTQETTKEKKKEAVVQASMAKNNTAIPSLVSTPFTETPSVISQPTEKTREEIMAERKAKKAEKAAKKSKSDKENKPREDTAKHKEQPENKESKESIQKQAAETAKPVEVAAVVQSVPEAASSPVKPTEQASIEAKNKAALKEERRLKQEAQRAAKAAASAAKSQEGISAKTEIKKIDARKTTVSDKSGVKRKPKSSKIQQTNLAKLLNHLQRINSEQPTTPGVHPAIVKLGLQYSSQQVAGSNARAVALMRAMKEVIEDYETPPHSELCRDLELRMQIYMDYLDRCRPISVSMANAMRDLKNKLQQIPGNVTDQEAKKQLIAAIDGQGKEDGLINKLELDCRSVSFNVVEKIKDEDMILTYGCSSLVQKVLVEAQNQGKRFRVIVVGARPWKEAEKMLHQLIKRGVRCSYLLISAISTVMKDVSKVLLGAHAILANGYVMARAGSSQVALIANSFNVPVIVCCETYKFCDRVQTDAFVYNELGDPHELVPGLQMANLTQCVLAYDVTPPQLVSTVVTEVSMLPCSSVPVVLHMQSSETRLKRRSTSSTGPAKA